jgi:hypothetical protein
MWIIEWILDAIVAYLSLNDEEWNVGRIVSILSVLVALAVFVYLVYR